MMIAAGILFAGACSTTQDTQPQFTTVTLEKPVHFSAPDGADVMAGPGRYSVDSVDSVEAARLRLTPTETRKKTSPLIVMAMVLPHDELIESGVALSVPNGTDEHHVVLLLPMGKGLDAGGTYSGVRSRGGSIGRISMVQVRAALVQRRPVLREPVAPSTGGDDSRP